MELLIYDAMALGHLAGGRRPLFWCLSVPGSTVWNEISSFLFVNCEGFSVDETT